MGIFVMPAVFAARKWVSAPSGLWLYDEGVGGDDWSVEFPWATLTRESDHLKIVCGRDDGGSWATINKVDVTNFSTLKVMWENTLQGGWTGLFQAGLITTRNSFSWTASVTRFTEEGIGAWEDQLDITSLSGEYFVRIYSEGGEAGNINKTYEVWLE